MSDPFEIFQLSPTDTLSIPTHTTLYRANVAVSAEFTFFQGDEQHRDGRIKNILIEANGGGGGSNALTLTQILGGHDGTHICIMLAHAGDSLTIVHDITKIALPFDTNMIITSHLRAVEFVNRGGVYAFKGN